MPVSYIGVPWFDSWLRLLIPAEWEVAVMAQVIEPATHTAVVGIWGMSLKL